MKQLRSSLLDILFAIYFNKVGTLLSTLLSKLFNFPLNITTLLYKKRRNATKPGFQRFKDRNTKR